MTTRSTDTRFFLPGWRRHRRALPGIVARGHGPGRSGFALLTRYRPGRRWPPTRLTARHAGGSRNGAPGPGGGPRYPRQGTSDLPAVERFSGDCDGRVFPHARTPDLDEGRPEAARAGGSGDGPASIPACPRRSASPRSRARRRGHPGLQRVAVPRAGPGEPDCPDLPVLAGDRRRRPVLGRHHQHRRPLRRQGDSRIEVIRLRRNAGLPAARNAGLAQVREPFVLFLDGDDALFPDALETRVQTLAEDPAAAGVYGKIRQVPFDATWRDEAARRRRKATDRRVSADQRGRGEPVRHPRGARSGRTRPAPSAGSTRACATAARTSTSGPEHCAPGWSSPAPARSTVSTGRRRRQWCRPAPSSTWTPW